MSAEGFARLLMGPGLATIVTVAVIWFAVWLVTKWIPQTEEAREVRKWINRGRFTATLIAVVVFVIFVVNAASTNLTPRSEIDRSDVNQQIEKFEKRHQMEDEGGRK